MRFYIRKGIDFLFLNFFKFFLYYNCNIKQNMTVAQLIEILNGFNPNDYVMIGNDGGAPSEACDVYQYDENTIEIY